MVQMDLVEWMEKRAALEHARETAPAHYSPAGRLARRGLYDVTTGRLYGVATFLPRGLTPAERARVTEDHEAILTDASRFGG
jgi:hypothetical protein